jgi:hypothetical protein
MSEPFFDPMRGGHPAADDHEPWIFLDPTLVQVDERERWELRAAQWQARALAEVVFGGEVEARLSGQTLGPFRGLLHLDVPFADLAEHHARERVFMSAAATDPVLARVPLVFVFGARAAVAR